MNTKLLNIVKRIIASRGEGILGDPQRLKALFSDLAKNEPKPLRGAFGRCIEAGAYAALKSAPDAAGRASRKASIERDLGGKYGLDPALCGEALDILEAALYGTAQMTHRTPASQERQAGTDAGGTLRRFGGGGQRPPPGKAPQKKKPPYLLIAAALAAAAVIGIAAYARHSSTEKVEILEQRMVLFFVIDSSGSMEGSKIDALNTAMQEVIPAIRDLAYETPGLVIEIAALAFDDGSRWLTPYGPVSTEDFYWEDIGSYGMTDLGAAFAALDEKLSASAFMRNAADSFTPAIFLLSDGIPSDDWQSALVKLRQNKLFNTAVKAAVAIGDDADKEVLRQFTGSMESVLEVHDAAMLIEMIKVVSLSASRAASSDADDKQKQKDLNAALNDFTRRTAPGNSGGGEW
jgi:uncharacterized protein YegL